MMKFTVAYEGGEEETYAVRPKHLVLAERNGGVEATVESSFKLAWLASGSKMDFDTWLDTVDEISPVDESEEPERPTSGE